MEDSHTYTHFSMFISIRVEICIHEVYNGRWVLYIFAILGLFTYLVAIFDSVLKTNLLDILVWRSQTYR